MGTNRSKELLLRIAMTLTLTLTGTARARQPVRAAADDKTAQARAHYQAGMAHFNLQEFDDAISEFEIAYRLHPDPVFLFNLGQCHRQANHSERALYFYRTYLRAIPEDGPYRLQVQRRVAALEKLVASTTSAPPPPAATKHDAAPPRAPTTAEAAPLARAPSPIARAPLTAMDLRAPVIRKPIYKRWWLWSAGGAVVAAAGVGLAVGLTRRAPTFDASLGTFHGALGAR